MTRRVLAVGVMALAQAVSACRPKQTAPARVERPAAPARVERPCVLTELVVTENGVGDLSIDSSIASLRAQCPQARDTSLLTMVSYEDRAIVISLSGATIVAWQQDSVLRPDRPADGWDVTGDSVQLPGHLALKSGWSTLARTYGRFVSDASESNPDTSGVVFCSMMGMGFTVPTAALAGGAAAAAHPVSVSIARNNAMFVASRCK